MIHIDKCGFIYSAIVPPSWRWHHTVLSKLTALWSTSVYKVISYVNKSLFKIIFRYVYQWYKRTFFLSDWSIIVLVELVTDNWLTGADRTVMAYWLRYLARDQKVAKPHNHQVVTFARFLMKTPNCPKMLFNYDFKLLWIKASAKWCKYKWTHFTKVKWYNAN